MKKIAPLRHVGHFFKLFMIGSFVVSRTTSGAAATEDSLRHELAWMAVRDGLSRTENGLELSAEVRRLVESGFNGDFEDRIRSSYLAIPADRIGQLDALWMDSFAANAADSDIVDRYLRVRTTTLPQLVQEKAAEMDSPEKWRAFVREFKRAPYSEG